MEKEIMIGIGVIIEKVVLPVLLVGLFLVLLPIVLPAWLIGRHYKKKGYDLSGH